MAVRQIDDLAGIIKERDPNKIGINEKNEWCRITTDFPGPIKLNWNAV